MSGYPVTSHDDERPPSLWWGMWKRFLIAGVLIVALSGAATATVTLNTVSGLAHDVFTKLNQIKTPQGLIKAPEYEGAPETFLILGSDRRSGSKNAEERGATPHSDTILLVRFDPSQHQTSVLSIPRDLMVNIYTKRGVYAKEKINAAYTIGAKLGGINAASVLAAETIKHEVFPGLELNGIIDVNFSGFIKVVDTLGCAYVNVDHRYYNANVGSTETDFTSINLQPGYQKLCYENALDYVRYRHTDSDFVRVARQQDFLRALRQQISPSNEIGQIDTVAKAVGHAIRSNFDASASKLIELSKLVAFSQSKPLRQVKFLSSNVDATFNGGSYVTSTPELEKKTLENFINGDEKLHLPSSKPPSKHHSSHGQRHHSASASVSARALNLFPTSSANESEAVKAAIEVPFPVLYPSFQSGQAEQQMVRPYILKDEHHRVHHAYVVVWQQNQIGGYYDFEGTDWLNPPLFAHTRNAKIDGREYKIVNDGAHIHVVGWQVGKVLYWLTNTLLEELSNSQMIFLARSAQPLH
jgi:polyisoprenyl-teichoic acid--peptidoglycan teichoic acid transferase